MEELAKKNENVSKTLQNMKPMKGLDGNCKRCEALIVVNGTYI